jgi:hypothetical protein
MYIVYRSSGKEVFNMVRVNLFETHLPLPPATWADIAHVTLAAFGFCVAAGAVTFVAVQLVLSLK